MKSKFTVNGSVSESDVPVSYEYPIFLCRNEQIVTIIKQFNGPWVLVRLENGHAQVGHQWSTLDEGVRSMITYGYRVVDVNIDVREAR